VSPPRSSPPDIGLPPDVAEALAKGQLIEAIKRLRAHGSLGLKEAKAQIERARRAGAEARGQGTAASPTPPVPGRARATGFADEEHDEWGRAPPPAPAIFDAGAPASFLPASFGNVALPTEVLDALQRGRRLEAVKRLRTATGMNLAQAREAVERAMNQSLHLTQTLDGRSPGEVPRSDNLLWLAAVIALLAWAAWQQGWLGPLGRLFG
jgi:ribosomal protein L7/L12